MRYTDAEIERAEHDICTIMGCDRAAAEPVFERAWKHAVERQMVTTDRAKVVYMSILGDVLQRISRGEGLVLPTVH